MVLDVTDGRRVLGMAVTACPHEARLVEADRDRLVQALSVRVEQGGAIGGDRVVDGVPVTGELSGDLFHRPTRTHLDRRPLRRPGREQAVLGGDAVVGEHPALSRAARVHTAHPVLSPAEAHRLAIDRQVDVGDKRSLLDQCRAATARTSLVGDHLLDDELNVRTSTFVVKDADVLQAHQGLEDLTRVGKDEGASVLLAHTSSLKRLRHFLVDRGREGSPLRSDEPNLLEAASGIEPLYRALQALA